MTTDTMVQQMEVLFDKWKGLELSIDDVTALNRTFRNFTRILCSGTVPPATELEQLKQWVDDLQCGRYINCVYCGHRYGPKENVPPSMQDILKAHVMECPKHPMNEFKNLLEEVCSDIENSGGLRQDEANPSLFCPVAAPDWIDMGLTYQKICEVLKREPKMIDSGAIDSDGKDNEVDDKIRPEGQRSDPEPT